MLNKLLNSKFDKQSLLAGITFAVLISLMVIQILFLFKASKIEERNFNHRVVLALRESRNEIAREAKACNHMRNYVCGNKCPTELQYINFQRVDSILQSNFTIHQINLDYKFEFINELEKGERQLCVTCYEQSLNGLLEQNGIKLHIEFPDQSKFFMAQMGALFYISIAAILFVTISFIFTSRLFRKEKANLANTKDFIDNMVHEFQTPISNIRLASNLIKKKALNASVEKISDYNELIQSENIKMESHVEDILRVATMVSQNQPKTMVDMHNLIQQCVKEFLPRVEDSNGKINYHLNASVYNMMGEAPYLKHAISNLIDNAIKYTKRKPEILVSTFNKKDCFYLEISDNGIGVMVKDYQNIFEKYYRVSTGNIHNIKGFGIGLNFVKKVMDIHKGSINIKSEIGKGSTFVLKFKV